MLSPLKIENITNQYNFFQTFKICALQFCFTQFGPSHKSSDFLDIYFVMRERIWYIIYYASVMDWQTVQKYRIQMVKLS